MTLRARLESLLGNSFARRFVGTAGLSLALRVAWAVANYAGVVLLARWLAPDSYGVFAMVMSFILPLSIICGVGLPTSVMRFLGQYEAKGQPGLAAGLLFHSRRIVTISALLTTAALIFGVWVLDAAGRVSQPLSYTVGFLILPSYALITLQSSVARTHGAVFSALAPRDVIWRVLLIPIGFVASLQAASSMQSLVLFSLGALTLLLLSMLQNHRIAAITPGDVIQARPEYDRSTWRKVSFPIWLSASAVTLGGNIDVLLVGSILSEADAGRYFLVQRTATLASFVLVSINLVIGPEVSKLYHAGNFGRLNRLLRMANLFVLLPSLAALAIFVFAGEWLLGVAGPEASALHVELVILGIGQCINAATGCVGVLLNMTGAEKVAAWIRLGFTAVGAAAMFVATSLYGTMGAAISAAAVLGGSNLLMAVYCRYAFGIDASAFAFISTPKARTSA
jgi:O-antigen/teichoic acid export membrane protein